MRHQLVASAHPLSTAWFSSGLQKSASKEEQCCSAWHCLSFSPAQRCCPGGFMAVAGSEVAMTVWWVSKQCLCKAECPGVWWGSGRGTQHWLGRCGTQQGTGITSAQTVGTLALPLPGAFTTPADTACELGKVLTEDSFFCCCLDSDRVRCHLHRTTLRLLLQCSTVRHSVKVVCTS